MQTLYYGGNILTMSKKMYTEAIVTEEDTIIFEGTLKAAKKFVNKTHRTVNLKGCALMPSFVEAHAHFNDIVYGYLSIDAREYWQTDDLLQAIVEFVRHNNLTPDQWVIVRHFDNMRMQKQSFPTLAELDQAAPDNPVVILHINNRMGIFNSKAYELAQQLYNDSSLSAHDGYVVQEEYMRLAHAVQSPSEQNILDAVGIAQRTLLKNGVTTATDCVLTQDYMSILRQIVDNHLLQMDVAAYVEYSAYDGFRRAFDNCIDKYYNGFRLAGIGIIIDGDLHHQSARVNDGYINDQQNNGKQLLSNQRLVKVMQTASKYGAQLAIQANGDVAVKQALWCYDKLDANIYRRARMSPILAHAHIVEQTLLKKMHHLRISPCFLIDDIVRHGDIDLHLLGNKFFRNCYPLKSAQDMHIKYSLCRDIGDTASSPLSCVQNAVLRTTNGGIVLNEAEKVAPIDALRAVTVNAAHALKEDDKKGTLLRGKKADMVILSDDPTTVADRKIAQIKVMQTIKDGVAVYTNKLWQQ